MILDPKTAALLRFNTANGNEVVCERLLYERMACYNYTNNGKGLEINFSDDPNDKSELFEAVRLVQCNEKVSFY